MKDSVLGLSLEDKVPNTEMRQSSKLADAATSGIERSHHENYTRKKKFNEDQDRKLSGAGRPSTRCHNDLRKTHSN